MTEVRLGDPKISEVSAGQAAPQSMQLFGKSGHPFIRAGSLEFLCSGGSIRELEHIEPSVAAEHRLKLFPKHTVVFAKSGMSAKIGRVYRLVEPSYVVSHLAAITPKEKLDSSYLLYFLQANPPAKLIPNDAYPSIRLSEIENIIVQLPLLEEQRRRADILDKADAIRRKRQQSLKLIDDLVKSQFIEKFGDPVTNPMGWANENLKTMIGTGKITYHLDGNHGGLYPRASEFVPEGVPYIGANCLKDGYVEYTNAKYLSSERASKIKKGIAKNGDVLFAHNATVGPVAMLKTGLPYIILSTSLTAYRCNKLDINPYYLKTYMESQAFIKQYEAGMGQTTRNQVPITAQREYFFLLPPIALQNEFARFVEQADKSKFAMQNQLSEIEILSSALKQKFFA